MTERWETIPGFEDYEVSDQGRVRSKARTVTVIRKVPAKVLKTQTNDKGSSTTVVLTKDGKRHGVSVGRLVLLAFVGEPTLPNAVAERQDLSKGPTANNLMWSDDDNK